MNGVAKLVILTGASALRTRWLVVCVCVSLSAATAVAWMLDRSEVPATMGDRIGFVVQGVIIIAVTAALNALQVALKRRDNDVKALARSQEQYRSLLENAQEGIFLADNEYTITSVNSKLAEMFGYSPAEAIGRNLLAFVPKTNANEILEALARGRQGVHERYENWLPRRDGTKVFVSISGSSLLDEQGCYAGLMGMVTDLTARKKAEELSSRLAAIVQSSQDAILGTTIDGIITDWNDGAEALYGYRREEVIGQPISLLIPQEKKGEEYDLLRTVRAGSFVTRFNTRRVCKDGRVLDVSVAVSPIVGKSGEILGASSIARDITERERMAEALRRSEDRFQLAMRATGDAVWDWDIVNDKVWWSERFWTMLGYEPAMFPQGLKGWEGLVHPDDAWVLPPSEGTYRTYEYRLRHADGHWVWVRDRASVICGEGGKRERMIGALTDITEAKQAEQALRSSEERYRRLFERNMAGVFRSSIDGTLLDCNEAFARFFGFGTPREMCGINMRELFVVAEKREETMRLVRESGHLVNCELEYRRRDGTQFIGLSNITLLPDHAGELTILEGTTLDVTDLRHLQQELLQAQKMEAIGRLAGGVAHDFNNLLMVISSYSELLLDKLTDHRQRRYVEQVQTAAKRASQLTGQLLAFSRKQVVAPRTLNINTVVHEVAMMLPRLIGENIALEINLADDLACCTADPVQIQQVIMNLAVNARDAMPEGGRILIETANVELGASDKAERMSSGKHVRLNVTDTGMGLDAATQARIFEPFFTTKEFGKGTGLGLSTVYGIVKQNNGFIEVQSQPGEGATFSVFLPAVAAKPEPVWSIQQRQLDTRTATVLLVEDDNALRGAAAEFLQSRGYSVIKACNADEALCHAQRHSGTIDVLLTDVIMPGKSGVELAKQISSLRPGMPVLYMSGYTADRMQNESPSIVAENFLQKPFTFELLSRKLAGILHEETAAD